MSLFYQSNLRADMIAVKRERPIDFHIDVVARNKPVYIPENYRPLT